MTPEQKKIIENSTKLSEEDKAVIFDLQRDLEKDWNMASQLKQLKKNEEMWNQIIKNGNHESSRLN